LEALSEDVGYGDITTNILIPGEVQCEASIIAEEKGIVAGVEEAILLLKEFEIYTTPILKDGDTIKKSGQVIIKMRGSMKNILTIERTLLNFLMRMCGIATVTHRLLTKARSVNPKIRIAATRKTAPLLNYFDKKAVAIGGGDTHRLRLDDCILIKDNHITLYKNIADIITKVKNKISFTSKIEIEAEKIDDALKAAELGADIIMLDNMQPYDIKKTIMELKNRNLLDKVILEASGGINEDNIIEYAKTGVDVISTGFITHSVKALNLKLEIDKII
ncbi:MAG: carboxylating nicotinate-nucleotide diphosphorylase, partial [Candidatus Odinarchaeia archaeon]